MRDLVLSGQVTPPSEELPDDFFVGPSVEDPDCSLRRFLSEERISDVPGSYEEGQDEPPRIPALGR